ncbi:MAG: hypothetical protein ACI4U4_00280 [Bacilli bacterium]
MRKSKISFDEKISWWKGDFFERDIIDLAIKKAYRDLMRTIRNFSNNKNHDKIIDNARKCIKKSINIMIDTNIESQSEFDKLHKKACYDLIETFEDQLFTIGQAQKWINMTFKYLHLLDYNKIECVYEYCHIPIDSYMLNITNYQISQPWSKLNDYDEYIKYQEWFRNKYSDEIPLDKEFYLWLEEAKKNRNN